MNERLEERILRSIGRKKFRDLLDIAFEHAIAESDYLSIGHKGNKFVGLCLKQRDEYIKLWKEEAFHYGTNIIFPKLSQADYRRMVKWEYEHQ